MVLSRQRFMFLTKAILTVCKHCFCYSNMLTTGTKKHFVSRKSLWASGLHINIKRWRQREYHCKTKEKSTQNKCQVCTKYEKETKKSWFLMEYVHNYKYKFKWRYDHRSGVCNLSNCKLVQKKFSGLQRDSNPWPLR